MPNSNIIYKLPVMMYSGFLTGMVLEFFLPRDHDDPNQFPGNVFKRNHTFNRQNIIFAGICIATWTAYFRQD